MFHCPKCHSDNVRRSRTRNRWEKWRKEITSKRPHRCRSCGWRGWHLNIGALVAGAHQSVVADPPNLKGTMLARKDPRLQFDLKTLDEFDRVRDKADGS